MMNFNELMLSGVYFLALLSVFALLFMVIISYWNKINSLSRPSLAGRAMLDALPPPRKASSAQEPVQKTANQTDSSSEVVPVPLKTKKEETTSANRVEQAHLMASTPFERSPQSM